MDYWINILKFALQVFWYRRYQIHSPSPPWVPVFLVNLTQIWQSAKTVKVSAQSSCFASDMSGHRTSCKKPELWEISTSQSAPFSFTIPIFFYLQMSKKWAIFDFPQNTQRKLSPTTGSCTAQHDVLIKLLLDSTSNFFIVKHMQLTKVVPNKFKTPLWPI